MMRAAMAPTHAGVKVRGDDLLPALAMHRLDSLIITPVDTANPTGAARAARTSKHSERDAALEAALAAFVDTLEDGARPFCLRLCALCM